MPLLLLQLLETTYLLFKNSYMFRSYQTIIKSHDGLLRQKLVAGRKNNTVIVLDGVLTFLLLSPELDFRFFSVLFLVGMV